MRDILNKEGFNDWTIKESSDGLCQFSTKTIYCPQNNFALFLHELAHAKTYEWNEKMGDKTGHHAIWGDEFTKLVKKYMKIKT